MDLKLYIYIYIYIYAHTHTHICKLCGNCFFKEIKSVIFNKAWFKKIKFNFKLFNWKKKLDHSLLCWDNNFSVPLILCYYLLQYVVTVVHNNTDVSILERVKDPNKYFTVIFAILKILYMFSMYVGLTKLSFIWKLYWESFIL